MASINGLTAEAMQAIRDGVIVDANVVAGHLILTRYDATEVDTGSVVGPTGSPGATSGELTALTAASTIPIGSSVDYCGSVAPDANWLLVAGQTVTSAQSLYPILWGRVPTAWKSGTSLIMPDSRRRVSVGYDSATAPYDVIGATGGEEKHALTDVEMPLHRHAIDHNHPDIVVTADGTLGHTFGFKNDGGTHSVTTVIVTEAPLLSGAYSILHANQTAFEGQSGWAGRDWIDEIDQEAHNNMQPYIVWTRIIKAK